jgi:hypothetical protein
LTVDSSQELPMLSELTATGGLEGVCDAQVKRKMFHFRIDNVRADS